MMLNEKEMTMMIDEIRDKLGDIGTKESRNVSVSTWNEESVWKEIIDYIYSAGYDAGYCESNMDWRKEVERFEK